MPQDLRIFMLQTKNDHLFKELSIQLQLHKNKAADIKKKIIFIVEETELTR